MEKLFLRKTDNTVELHLTPLTHLHIAMKRRVIRKTIEAITGLRGICMNHIDAVIALIKEGRVGASSHLPGGIRAIKEYNTLKLTTCLPKKLSSYALDVPGSLYLPESALTLEASVVQGKANMPDRPDIAVFDFNRIQLPLCVRSRQPGDFFFPFGFGKRKKLQDLFVDLKIPREQRDTIPLVISGEDIIWVAGYRTDERYSVSDNTQSYLFLKLVN
jgi:tRNA(Ile)-lysidine synthase